MATVLPYQDRMSLNTSYSADGRVRTVEFGDGYIQRYAKGIHHQRRTISVVHEHMSQTDAEFLILFYEGRMFDLDYIEINQSALLRTPGKFFVESFDVQMTSDETRTITASMIEVFDL